MFTLNKWSSLLPKVVLNTGEVVEGIEKEVEIKALEFKVLVVLCIHSGLSFSSSYYKNYFSNKLDFSITLCFICKKISSFFGKFFLKK